MSIEQVDQYEKYVAYCRRLKIEPAPIERWAKAVAKIPSANISDLPGKR